MTSKFTAEQRNQAIEFMENNEEMDIIDTCDFVKLYEPYQIALVVKGSNLKLDCDYIRLNTYYDDVHEADTIEELVSDEEVEEALEEM